MKTKVKDKASSLADALDDALNNLGCGIDNLDSALDSAMSHCQGVTAKFGQLSAVFDHARHNESGELIVADLDVDAVRRIADELADLAEGFEMAAAELEDWTGGDLAGEVRALRGRLD